MGSQIVSRDERFEKMKAMVLSAKSLEAISNALPEHLNAKKMARVVITAITRSPKLLDCTSASIMQAVLEASSLGLMPDGVLGHGYIIPFKDTAVFIPGYRGMLDMARRSGEIAWVQARPVYENDDFSYTYGMEPSLQHTAARAVGKKPGELIAVYAVAKFKIGEHQFEVMHKDEIEDIRRQSRAGDKKDAPWHTHYEPMAIKSVIRRLCKYLPMNPEYQMMVTRDEYHDAGVLGTVIEVDPDTGEVTEPASAGSMLDMFSGQLEDQPAPIGDVPFGGPETAEEPAPKEQPPAEPPPKAKPEDTQPGVPDPEPSSDDIKQDGSGRISRQEDAAFIVALENLKERMRKVQNEGLIEQVINRSLGIFGAEKPIEIRSRTEREKFYRELRQMCEQWESLSRLPTDD